jgi:hypothetical protein
MHINGNSMVVNQANFYAAAQGRRAASGEHSAEVRKKLLRSAAGLDGVTPEEALMIGLWLDLRPNSMLTDDESRVPASGKDFDF